MTCCQICNTWSQSNASEGCLSVLSVKSSIVEAQRTWEAHSGEVASEVQARLFGPAVPLQCYL